MTTKEVIKKDKDKKRATYDTNYPLPTSLIKLKSHYDYQKLLKESILIQDLKIQFKYKQSNNSKATFLRCQFYIDTLKTSVLRQLTFKDCTFDHCFLGSVTYLNVRFERCNFLNCDFSNSRFEYCVFDSCNFQKCSAYHPEFISTEITPSFLKGITLLSENYNSLTPEIQDSFCYMKLAIAKKVYNSNNSIDSHTLSDQSLYELKKAEYEHIKRLIRNYFKTKKYKNGIRNVVYVFFKWLNLRLTDGGTSLLKLLGYTIFFILIVNIYFSTSNIIDSNYDFTPSESFILKYLQWLPRTTSIVLGYGYTGYKSSNLIDYFLINTSVVLGLFSYALLISVLMRKIYK